MVAPSNHDFGFDINLARANLVDWLVLARVVKAKQIDEWAKQWRAPVDVAASRTALEERGESRKRIEQLTSDWQATINTRAEASDEDVAWAITMNIAQVHADAHGPPVVVGGRRVPKVRCSQFPCKALGVSFALMELLEAHRERLVSEVAIGEGMAELAKLLQPAAALAKKLENTVRREQRRYQEMAKHFRPGALHQSWVHCIALIAQIKHLPKTVDAESLAVRKHLLARELRGRPLGTPGRPKQALLPAVCRHLASMGFPRAEISARVLGTKSKRAGAAGIDRVRKLTKRPDSRTIGPWIPDGLDDDSLSHDA